MSVPPQISEKTRETIRAFLTFNLCGSGVGQTFFRRVDKVTGKDLQYIAKVQTPDLPVEYLDDLKGVSKQDIAKHIQVVYKSFHGVTRTQMIRDEPVGVIDTPIFFSSRNYQQLDLSVDMTFNFSTHKKLTKPVTPVPGDLIFIFLSNETLDKITEKSEFSNDKKSKYPCADMWFIASEQFLKAYTAIVYDWNDSFNMLMSVPVDAPRDILEESLKQKLFSGNKLMTNSWEKYSLELESLGKTMTREESIKRYWILRTEYVSKRWIDVWAALVLIARYGELPCTVNIPNTKGSGKRVKWDIPHNLVSSLINKALQCDEVSIREIDNLVRNSGYFIEKSNKKNSSKSAGIPPVDVIATQRALPIVDNTDVLSTISGKIITPEELFKTHHDPSSWASKVKGAGIPVPT